MVGKKRKVQMLHEQMKRKTLCLVQSNNRRQKFDFFSNKEIKIVIEVTKLRVKMATN